jgi:predicted DNA-binding protein (MmcQ/YjbR family)
MNIESYREYCLKKRGVTESFPFPNIPNVLVFKVAGKMFTATDVSSFASIRVKCDPDKIDELRASFPAVTTPVYLSKRHWNSVMMDHSLPDKLLYDWIDHSYDLVVAKFTPREKEILKKAGANKRQGKK